MTWGLPVGFAPSLCKGESERSGSLPKAAPHPEWQSLSPALRKCPWVTGPWGRLCCEVNRAPRGRTLQGNGVNHAQLPSVDSLGRLGWPVESHLVVLPAGDAGRCLGTSVVVATGGAPGFESGRGRCTAPPSTQDGPAPVASTEGEGPWLTP